MMWNVMVCSLFVIMIMMLIYHIRFHLHSKQNNRTSCYVYAFAGETKPNHKAHSDDHDDNSTTHTEPPFDAMHTLQTAHYLRNFQFKVQKEHHHHYHLCRYFTWWYSYDDDPHHHIILVKIYGAVLALAREDTVHSFQENKILIQWRKMIHEPIKWN